MEEMKSWMVDNSLGMLCDIRVRETVDAVINKSISHWGKIDIVAKYVCTVLHLLNGAFVVQILNKPAH
jgi:hypothetical protein